jgi:Transmembrane protein 33/Nucleoporin POM33
LTFPPGRDDLAIKYQAKWYKREIEPDFDIDSVITSPSAPKVEKAHICTEHCNHNHGASSNVNANATAAPSPSSATPTPPISSLQTRPSFIDMALLAGHILLFISCLMALQPFNPLLRMKGLAQCNKFSLPVHAVRLIRKVGTPGSAAGGISTWFKSVSQTTESFHIFLISMAASNSSAWTGILPVAILSLYHISATLNILFNKTTIWQRIGAAKVHMYLTVHQHNALQAMAILEIGTFFSVLLSVPQKGAFGLFAVYAFAAQLRMRYWSPESRVYHVNGWRRLGETVKPVVSKFGLVQRIVERGEKFFEAGRPAPVVTTKKE